MLGLTGDMSSKPDDQHKSGNTIVIAAAFIAAVKLAREENLNSPRAKSKLEDSITLAHRIYWRTREMFPTLF